MLIGRSVRLPGAIERRGLRHVTAPVAQDDLREYLAARHPDWSATAIAEVAGRLQLFADGLAHDPVSAQAEAALRRFGGDAITRVLAAGRTAAPSLRGATISMIPQLAPREAEPLAAMREALAEKEPEVAVPALKSVAIIGVAEDLGSIAKLVVSRDPKIASAAEGVVLAERAGLHLDSVADGIASGQAASPQVVRNVRRFAQGDHTTNIVFTPKLRLKDVDYALRLARKLGVPREFGEVAERLYREACERGFSSDNESRIVDVLRSGS